MRRSLRARLILMTGAVVLASIVAVAFLASRLSRTQFHKLEKITILKGPDGQRVTRRSTLQSLLRDRIGHYPHPGRRHQSRRPHYWTDRL